MSEPIDLNAAKAKRRKPFERGDHVELAVRLVSILRDDAPTVFTDGQLWQYDDAAHIFKSVDSARVSQILQDFAGITINSGKPHPLRLKAADVSGATQLAHHRVTEPDFFLQAPRGIVFGNGFVQVTTEGIELKGHSPDHRARFAYPFAFDRDARPQRFLRYLDEVFRDDEDRADKIKLVQDYGGTALLGLSTRYQQALVLKGDGDNGKSVLCMIIEAAMPPGSTCSIPPQDFAQEYRRAMLAGKLLNVVSELPESEILESEAFKDIVAGDSTTGRHIRQAPFTFRATAGHVFSANRLPGTVDQSHAFWRRFLVLTFNRIFTEHEKDRTLARHIVDHELGAVVSWLLIGGHRVELLKHYTLPASHLAALESWKHHADQIRVFIDDRCDRLPPETESCDWERADPLYRRYRNWASDNGHKALSSISFAERMRILGLPRKHTRSGNVYPVRLKGVEEYDY